MKMNKKEASESGKRPDAAGIATLALCAYSAISFIILLIAGKLIPAPLAEYVAFSYACGKGGKPAFCVLFSVLYAAALILCSLNCIERFRTKLVPKITATLLVFADLAVHAYAFLAASGYQWIYLICAVLDGVLLLCLLYRPGKNKRKG